MPLTIGTPLPTFEGATDALNIPEQPFIPSFPLIVHFWAMSCPVCKNNMSSLHDLYTMYREAGISLVAVHMPRGPVDLDTERVKQSLVELNMTEICFIDNEHIVGDRFQTNGLWPLYYLFDANGMLKRHAAGSVGLRLIKSALENMYPESAIPSANQVDVVD